MYGLSDAARAWYDTVKEELLKLGLRMSKFDPAMFMFERNDMLEGLVCIHVDDFCWGGTALFEDCVVSKLKEDFLVGATDSKEFRYVGMNIKQEPEGIAVDQEKYIKSLNQVEVSQKKALRRDAYLNEDESHQYRSLVGQLN